MRRIVVNLVAVFILFTSFQVFADEAENNFKKICNDLNDILYEKVSPVKASDNETEKQTLSRYLDKWNNEFLDFSNSYPSSIWADDALYLIGSLNWQDRKKQTSSLEYLLSRYPNIHLEDWTRQNMEVPSKAENSDRILVLIELLMNYDYLGDIEKIKIRCSELVKEEPEKGSKLCNLLLERGSKRHTEN